jgi:hypothetical protein
MYITLQRRLNVNAEFKYSVKDTSRGRKWYKYGNTTNNTAHKSSNEADNTRTLN